MNILSVTASGAGNVTYNLSSSFSEIETDRRVQGSMWVSEPGILSMKKRDFVIRNVKKLNCPSYGHPSTITIEAFHVKITWCPTVCKTISGIFDIIQNRIKALSLSHYGTQELDSFLRGQKPLL
ncbi:hypothetical protein STEG23_001149 [Scotinomys teguina]